MGEIKRLPVDEAVRHIANTCERSKTYHPFFFMVGAGVSCPPVPLAGQIIKHCKEEVGTPLEASKSSMQEYARWLERAYHSPQDRSRYFRELIEGRAIPHANLRLAHLLYSKRVSNLVVTTNFDDFISRALSTFGAPHAVCDHPATVGRIEPERDDLQILHVHGSYWFYDCRNLTAEIQDRAARSESTTADMAHCLDRLLSNRSPLIVGYSGWESDVFMTAFRRRLASGLRYNAYWFCYRAAEIDSLPPDVKEHQNVYFVTPAQKRSESPPPSGSNRSGDPASESRSYGALPQPAGRSAAQDPHVARHSGVRRIACRSSSRRSAAHTGSAAILLLHLRPPFLLRTTRRPARAASTPREEPSRSSRGARRGQARRIVVQAAESLGKVFPSICALPSSILRSEAAAEISVSRISTATQGASGSSSSRLRDPTPREGTGQRRLGSTGVPAVVEEDLYTYLLGEPIVGSADSVFAARARLALADALFGVSDWERAVETYGHVVALLADSDELSSRELVAKALGRKGHALGLLKRDAEALTTFADVVERFGDASEAGLREPVAWALFNKGVALGRLDRPQDQLNAYDAVVDRFGDAPQPGLREQVAWALFNKGGVLSRLDRPLDELKAYDAVVERFADADDSPLREPVAWALVNKGVALGRLERPREQLAAYNDVVQRFGDAEEVSLREQVALALGNMGVALGRLDRPEEELAAYDDVVERFGDAEEAGLREQVAMALNSRAFARLCAAKRLWKSDAGSARELLVKAEEDIEDSLHRTPQHAVALGNKAYILFLLDRKQEARGKP